MLGLMSELIEQIRLPSMVHNFLQWSPDRLDAQTSQG